MFNALFIATPAEGLAQDAKTEAIATLRSLCADLTDAFVCAVCPEDSSTNAGAFFCELAFADQESLEAARQTAAWSQLHGMLHDEALAQLCEFALYGGGELKVTDPGCTCHRVMAVRLAEGVDPDRVADMCERLMRVDAYVAGLKNMQVAPVFESSGSGTWDYVYDCDFASPADYLQTYMRSPYHWGYLRLAQSDCVEYVMAAQLSPYVETETAFLSMLDA